MDIQAEGDNVIGLGNWLKRSARKQDMTQADFMKFSMCVGIMNDLRATVQERKEQGELESDDRGIQFQAKRRTAKRKQYSLKTLEDFEQRHWMLLTYAGWVYTANTYHDSFSIGMAVHSTDIPFEIVVTRLRQLMVNDFLEVVNPVTYRISYRGIVWLKHRNLEIGTIPAQPLYVSMGRDAWEAPITLNESLAK